MSLIVPPHVAQARQKEKLEASLPPHRCGNCWYAVDHPSDAGQIECQGLPPTPLLAGATQNPVTGEVRPNILLFRPHLPRALRRCALWVEKDIDGAPTGDQRPS